MKIYQINPCKKFLNGFGIIEKLYGITELSAPAQAGGNKHYTKK